MTDTQIFKEIVFKRTNFGTVHCVPISSGSLKRFSIDCGLHSMYRGLIRGITFIYQTTCFSIHDLYL